jgi:hypothetical protein
MKALSTQAITSRKQDTLRSLLIPVSTQGFRTPLRKHNAVLCQTVVAQESGILLDRKENNAEQSADHLP